MRRSVISHEECGVTLPALSVIRWSPRTSITDVISFFIVHMSRHTLGTTIYLGTRSVIDETRQIAKIPSIEIQVFV